MSANVFPHSLVRGARIPAALRTRIAFLIPFLVSGTLVWVGIARMRPALRESAALSRSLATLLGRLETGDRDSREAGEEGLEVRVRTIHESWIRDVSELERWITEAVRTASAQGWQLRHEPGPIESPESGDLPVSSVTVHLTLRSAPGIGTKSLLDLLRVGDAITHTRNRPDLTELNVTAPTSGIAEAKLAIRFRTIPPSP
ncbi:MAG: hypothetical protein JNL10_19605 [Verrucomicrobiales bacterium]|nr:hypothetical protein [Verrucomicrobiales bacterium]